MPNLFPEGYENEIIEAADLAEEKPVGYRNAAAFDNEIGDFLRDGQNKILDSDGVESWKAWVINCICTERYKHLAYRSDFGIELDLVFGAGSREEAESVLTRQITEAILADPYGRAEYIEEITFNWTAPDAVLVKLTIKGIEEVSIDLEAYITKGA